AARHSRRSTAGRPGIRREHAWNAGRRPHRLNNRGTVNMSIIDVEQVTKAFERPDGVFSVIGPITFRVLESEIIGIVGISGSGKTTLLNLLSGAIAPTAGSVSIRSTLPRRKAIGRVFQSESVFPWMTVKENVSFGLTDNDEPVEQRDEVAR